MYVDPGTLMPIASALAAIVGGLMLFWRRTVALLRSGLQYVGGLFTRRTPGRS